MTKITKADLKKKIEALKGQSRTKVLKQLRSYVNKCEGISTFAELKALVSKHTKRINPLEGKISVVTPKKHKKPEKIIYVKGKRTTKATPQKGLITRHSNTEQYGKVLYYQDTASGRVHKVRIPISINQADDWGEARKYCQEKFNTKGHGIFVTRVVYRAQFKPKDLVKNKVVKTNTKTAISIVKEYDPDAYVKTNKKGIKQYGKFVHTKQSKEQLAKKFQIIEVTDKKGNKHLIKVHKTLVSSVKTTHSYQVLPRGESRQQTYIKPPKINSIKKEAKIIDAAAKAKSRDHKISASRVKAHLKKKKVKTIHIKDKKTGKTYIKTTKIPYKKKKHYKNSKDFSRKQSKKKLKLEAHVTK